MKKNCSILTLKTKNYGGILQAIALQKVVTDFGWHCETVDVAINKQKRKISRSFLSFLYQKIYIKLLGDKKRASRTKRFRLENMNISKPYKEKNVQRYFQETKIDALIVGSDQVWNDKMFNNSDVFFFPYQKSSRLLSYGASFGYSLQTCEPSPRHLELIRAFDAVSVREKDAENYLQSKNIPATTVLDPTFLLDKEEWIRMASSREIDKSSEDYGFVYIMPGDKKMVSFIRRAAHYYSEKYHTKFYIIGLKDTEKLHNNKENLFGVGPAEWLHLLIHSKWVLTNSFHGTAFSLIFGKKFCAVINGGSNVNYPGRIKNLLDSVGATDNLVDISSFSSYPSLDKQVLFQDVFGKEITRSKQWLKESLLGEDKDGK